MATQTAFQEQHDALNGIVRAWDRRLRAQKTLVWLPRSVIPGLILGLVMLLIARTRPFLANEQIVMITAVAVLLGIATMLLVVWLRPRSNLEAARSFDVMFNLGERTSTALELIAGQIRSNDELTSFQLQDAWEKARVVNANDQIPFIWDWRSWLGALGILGIFLLLLVLPNSQTEAANQGKEGEIAITDAGTAVNEITQNIASDPALTDEERAQLLQELEKTSEKLAEPEVKPEEAFAALSDAESELREQAQNMDQAAQDQRAGMEQAAEALRELSEMADAPQQSQQGQQGQDAIQTLEQLQQNMEGMSEAERMETADALDQAAEALQDANPQAAQSLREAADALRNGDMQAAQNAMQQAAENMQQGQQEMQQQSSSAQQMNEAAQQLNNAAQQISQSSQPNAQNQQSSSESQPSDSQTGEQQSGEQQGSEGVQEIQQQSEQPGQQGQQPGEGQQPGDSQSQSGQSGQQPGDQGQPGSQSSQMQADSSGEGQEGNNSSESQPSGSQQPGEGSGAGDTQGDAGSDQNSTQGSTNTGVQDNEPDGTGEGEMPLVYTPQRVGGEGDEQIFLEPDASDIPATEGEFSQNPDGQSLVPYNQVYGEYLTEANRSLESDYIPLGLRDVVRDYFTSLEPGQSQPR